MRNVYHALGRELEEIVLRAQEIAVVSRLSKRELNERTARRVLELALRRIDELRAKT
ncbi:hypothetical protein [Methylocystis sp.]|uniref:hypothetical protein n=1 Tax=Methylocystis sp. TaxID=1911079 RepID=UPI003D129631